jgi:hypothetical protein
MPYKDKLGEINRALECVCPRCGAGREEPCRNKGRRPRKQLHADRLKMVR